MNTPLTSAEAPPGYFDELASRGLSPGWAKKRPQMWPTPRPHYVPAVWRYADARAALDRACDFVSPEFAERRNLIMVNPVPENVYPTSRNLVAAYQLVLPGETARSHRHTPNALRIILDAGDRTYTVVNGVKVDVAPGDVVLTPSWHWHGHTNAGDEPAFWIDILDVPLVQHLENMFFQDYPERNEPVTGHEPDSSLRHKGVDLARAVRETALVDVAAGFYQSIGIQAIGLTPGDERIHRSRHESNIYVVLEGSVCFDVAQLGKTELSRGDVIVVPGWHDFAFEAMSARAQLVRVTDAPVFDALGFNREMTGRE
jgi:gentisate 1,2-dioxygenase